MDPRKAMGGFTLVEILVVLILTGLVTTLLFQGLQQVFRLQGHFGAEIFSNQQGAMQTAWYRQAVNGLMPDHADGKRRFRGEERRFEGLTLAALEAQEGSLGPIILRLRFDPRRAETVLESGAEDGGVEYLSWKGNSGKFTYLDAVGGPHDSWPPFLGQWPQLPSAIRLEAGDSGRPRVVIAAPKGPATTSLRLKDVEGL